MEPSVPDPKENPVDMAAVGATPSARMERPGTLLSPQCRGRTCNIAVAQKRQGGKFNPSSKQRGEDGGGGAARQRTRDAARAPNAPEASAPDAQGPLGSEWRRC